MSSIVGLAKNVNIQKSLENIFGPNAGLIVIYVVCILLISIIFLQILTRYKKKIGELILSEDKIVIHSASECFEFNINQITNFKIELSKRFIRKEHLSLSNSYENWLYFKVQAVDHKYQFILNSYHTGKAIKEVIDIWLNKSTIHILETDN